MMKDFYNELLDYLKQKKPTASNPAGLTDKVMQAVQRSNSRNSLNIFFRVREQKLYLYHVMRVITTTAAVVLTVFFIKEQWEMNQKISRLENELVSAPFSDVYYKYPSRSEKIQQVLYELQEEYPAADDNADSLKAIRINRKSLNFLLNRIRELERENMNYRTRLIQTYSDSTLFYKK